MYGSFQLVSHASHRLSRPLLHHLGHEQLDICQTTAQPLQCRFLCLHQRIDGRLQSSFIHSPKTKFIYCCRICFQGDIASASGSFLYLWNINGEKLASINTMPSTRNHVILSICMSQVNEWDQNNVIMTGGTDGVIRVKTIRS